MLIISLNNSVALAIWKHFPKVRFLSLSNLFWMLGSHVLQMMLSLLMESFDTNCTCWGLSDTAIYSVVCFLVSGTKTMMSRTSVRQKSQYSNIFINYFNVLYRLLCRSTTLFSCLSHLFLPVSVPRLTFTAIFMVAYVDILDNKI